MVDTFVILYNEEILLQEKLSIYQLSKYILKSTTFSYNMILALPYCM